MSEIIPTLSVLIIFVTIFLDILSKEINDYLEDLWESAQYEHYDESSDDPVLDRFINDELPSQRTVLRIKSLSLLFSIIILFYLLLPKSYSIIKNQNFTLWNFELNSTLFIFLEFYLVMAIIWTSKLVYDLFLERPLDN